MLWIVALVGVAGIYVGLSTAVMAASFTVAHPEREQHWRTIYLVYLGVAAVSAVGALASFVALFRTRARPRRG